MGRGGLTSADILSGATPRVGKRAAKAAGALRRESPEDFFYALPAGEKVAVPLTTKLIALIRQQARECEESAKKEPRYARYADYYHEVARRLERRRKRGQKLINCTIKDTMDTVWIETPDGEDHFALDGGSDGSVLVTHADFDLDHIVERFDQGIVLEAEHMELKRIPRSEARVLD